MVSSALLPGCSGGGGSGGGGSGASGGSGSFKFSGLAYQRQRPSGDQNWSGNKNWELGRFLNGVLQDSKPTTDSKPSSGSSVYLEQETINVNGADVNQSLGTLVLNGTILNINGAGNNFRVEKLNIAGGKVNIWKGSLIIDDLNFEGGNIKSIEGNIVLTNSMTIPSGAGFSGVGSIGKNLINYGHLTLKSGGRLTVGSFNNRGILNVYLNDSSSDALLTSSGQIVLGGRLRVFGGTVGNRYTLLQGSLIVSNFKSTSGNFAPEKTVNQYSVTLNSVVHAPSISRSMAAPMFHGAGSMGMVLSSSYLNSLQSGMDLMYQSDKVLLNADTAVVTTSKNDEQFFGLNQKHMNGSFGLYLEYVDFEKMDFGAYDLRKFGGFKLLNVVHMGKNEDFTFNARSVSQIKTSFFQVKSELSHTFELGQISFSPKIIASYGNILDIHGALKTDGDSFHMETTGKGFLQGGLALDIASRTRIQSTPIEAFASLSFFYENGGSLAFVREGDGSRLNNPAGFEASLNLGVKAELDEKTNIYTRANLSSLENNSLEFGLKVTF